MAQDTSTSQPRREAAKGLATLALLEANFDSGRDHIEMFLPFVFDTIGVLPAGDFAVEDVRALLESRHHLRMPLPTMRTILSRAVKRGALQRKGGRFFRDASFPISSDLTSSREAMEREQRRLAAALVAFGQTNGVAVPTEDEALALLLDFLAQHHVSLILEADIASGTKQLIGSRASPLTSRNGRLVARFITEEGIRDPALLEILRRMLEGFVLQNALFLRDINEATRRFSDLVVFFDTGFLLEALGLKGKAAGLAGSESLDLLRETGAQLAVFENTVDEVKRILHVYEGKLGTSDGIASLYPTEVTRYVLLHHLTPSDMREIISLLGFNLRGLGLTIRRIPPHDPRYTLDEAKLTEMIKGPAESDLHPRVVHDVDCIAAVLTLRAGHSSQMYDDAKAVFATTTGLLVTHTRQWFHASDEPGVAPVMHQLALSNMAWLKKPRAASSLKLHELVALCYAALVPPRKTWGLFTKRLRDLRDSNRLSSDEMVAIVAGDLTDSLLSRFDDDVDPDANTIEEVIERVREDYQRDALQTIREAEERNAGKLADEAAARRSAEEEVKKREEELRKLVLAIRSKSLKLARRISWGLFVLTTVIVVIGSSVYFYELLGTQSAAAKAVGYVVWVFIWLLGIVRVIWGGYLNQWRNYLEARLEKLIRRWLLGDEKGDKSNY